jgi:hypothetical protein
MEKTIINVPLNVPNKLIEDGLVALYAKDKGWQEDGELTPVEYLIKHVQMMVKNDFQHTYNQYVLSQATKKAQEDIDSLFA